MASLIDTLITKYELDDKHYRAGAKGVLTATDHIAARIRGATGLLSSFARSMMSPLAGLAALAGGAGLIGLGAAAVKTAVDLEALKAGLTAITGSAAEAERQFAILRALAKEPGLGLFEAIQGGTALEAAGLPFETVVMALKGFGNALATVGKGKAELELVTLALGQMATSGKVLGQDLRQLQQQLPQIRKIMQEAFGTAQPEELEKMGIDAVTFITTVSREFTKLQSTGNTAKNTFENLGDNIKVAMATAGQSILKVLMPAVDALSNALQNIVDSGLLQRVIDGFTDLFSGKNMGDAVQRALAWMLAAMQAMPAVLQNLGTNFASVFKWMRDNIIVVGAVFGAIFIGGPLIRGVLALVRVFKILTLAIREAGLVAVIMEAITTGGASLVANVAGLALGLAASYGIIKAIEAALPKLPAMVGIPSMADLRKQMESNLTAMQGGAPSAGGVPGIIGQAASAIAETARSTAETAANTAKLVQIDFRKYAFGGGNLGALGVTPVEMAGGGRVQINAPRGPQIVIDAHAYIQNIIGQHARAMRR